MKSPGGENNSSNVYPEQQKIKSSCWHPLQLLTVSSLARPAVNHCHWRRALRSGFMCGFYLRILLIYQSPSPFFGIGDESSTASPGIVPPHSRGVLIYLGRGGGYSPRAVGGLRMPLLHVRGSSSSPFQQEPLAKFFLPIRPSLTLTGDIKEESSAVG